jgi:uncharacterized protein
VARFERVAGLVSPTDAAAATLRPLSLGDVSITGGFWADRLRLNRETTIPHGFEQLDQAGNLQNLRLAAGATGRYRALGLMFGAPFPFLDSDVYKWLEAVGWELGRDESAELRRQADIAIDLVARAQRPDGYLNSFVQVLAPDKAYADLRWGHELYCVGHLIQASIAWQRAIGDERLLEIAVRAAASVERELGPDAREGIDGHPEIEMALVELYRTTGDRRHLETAARFVERRGHGLLGSDRFGEAYWQDHAPVRVATSVAGHAVRQLYLDCGAIDVATELGDTELLGAVHRRWRDMVATRTYLTGGLGSRHRDESFGDPYELPPDRAYAESCAAIAGTMLAWRLLLATGDPTCADAIERTMLNGVLPAIGRTGTSFFYVNPLQRRTVRAAADPGAGERQAWYPCACCPPNIMRTLSSWEQLLVTTDPSGVQVHQYADAEIRADVAGGEVRLRMATGYPWAGQVTIDIVAAPSEPWTLTLRRPAWARDGQVTWPDGAGAREADTRTATWRPGDRVVVDLDMEPRVVAPDPRIDAVRDCVALERGPLVYCIETADLPAGTALEELSLEPVIEPVAQPRPDLLDGAVGLAVRATRRTRDDHAWPYDETPPDEETPPDPPSSSSERTEEVRAIPYLAWANRGPGAMRVWIPRDGGAA